jgi:hypothetical protein
MVVGNVKNSSRTGQVCVLVEENLDAFVVRGASHDSRKSANSTECARASKRKMRNVRDMRSMLSWMYENTSVQTTSSLRLEILPNLMLLLLINPYTA